jgi:hypothetical protein
MRKMSKKMPTKKQSEIIEAIKSTLENSSINGIPNIIRNKFNLVKLVWLVCILASSGVCAWFVLDIITKYFQREVVSRINVKKEPALPFPIVYICDNFGDSNPINLNDRIMSATFDSQPLNKEEEFQKNNIMKFSCFQFNSKKNFKNIKNMPSLAYLELEMYIGSPMKIKESKFFGLIIKLSDTSQSTTSRIDDIHIMPGTFNKIYVHRTIVKKQPEPYSNCIDNLNSPVFNIFNWKFFL